MRADGRAWLVPLADLSLILFMFTAAALATMDDIVPPANVQAPEQQGSFAQGVASAVFVDVPGGPSLGEWLATTRPGPGEQLTIEARFTPDARVQLAERAEGLARQALAAGVAARVILQPASSNRVQAVIAADAEFVEQAAATGTGFAGTGATQNPL